MSLRVCRSFEARRVRLAGAKTGQIRALQSDHTGTQRDYIVVPVVALMEGVIWPVNAESPEYVPVDVLAVAPGGWNGRPLMPDHPRINGEYVSANDPRVLASHCFGSIFNACTSQQVMETKRLLVEAWIDVARAKSIGGEALSVLTRCEADELVDVSIGALTLQVNQTGDFQGTPYKARWTAIVPDHLAMLPEGVKGACSVDMGCGAPRAARRHQVTVAGLRPVPSEEAMPNTTTTETETGKRSLRERFAALVQQWRVREDQFRANATEDVSDMELRGKLERALMATVPAFLGVDSVFSSENKVVYATAPDPYGPVLFFRRSYAMSEDGSVTLKDAEESVAEVRRFEPVAASGQPPCGCQNNPAAAPVAAAHTGETMKTKPERVTALITNPKTAFGEADRAALEGLSDERLATFEAAAASDEAKTKSARAQALIDKGKYTSADKSFLEALSEATLTKLEADATATPAAAPAPSTGTPAPSTTVVDSTTPKALDPEDAIKQLPADVQQDIAAARAAKAARKTLLVGKLKAAAHVAKVHTEAELTAMDVAALEKLATLAGLDSDGQAPSGAGTVLDFAGRGLPRVAAGGDEGVPASAGLMGAIAAEKK